jgi:hypothetical protein
MSNFGGRWGQPKKMKLILGISFFRQYNSTGGGFLILKQIISCVPQKTQSQQAMTKVKYVLVPDVK